MYENLWNRQRCVQVIMESTKNDGFLVSYALLLAMEMLDIGKLNELADVIADPGLRAAAESTERARKLAEERWHPSRFS